MKTDQHVNSTFNPMLLPVSFMLPYKDFQNQTKKSTNLHAKIGPGSKRHKLPYMGKVKARFARFCQRFQTVFSTVPAILSTLASYLEDYCCWGQKYKAIVHFIFQYAFVNLLFLKFAFDPFVFRWRPCRHRKALKTILCFHFGRVRPRSGTKD